MIAADAVLILPDDRSATRYPFAIARDKFNFLLSITRAWHVAQAGIVARPPLGDAGEGAERPKAVGDLNSAGVGRRENHRRTQQRECQSAAFCTGAMPTTLRRTFWLTWILSIGGRPGCLSPNLAPSDEIPPIKRQHRGSNRNGRDCCERKTRRRLICLVSPMMFLGAFPPRTRPFKNPVEIATE